MNDNRVNPPSRPPQPSQPSPPSLSKPPHDTVWTYGGYQISSSNFMTAMVHFYRGELQRANTWRNRLDVTTNWAVISTGAALSFAFGDAGVHHSVMLLLSFLITLFCMIEARRYRYYELWSYRVRLMEIDFYAAMLVPPFKPRPDWGNRLADSLAKADYPITFAEALGHRLRRNYIWIYGIIGVAWIAKLLLYSPPDSVLTLESLVSRARMGVLRGEVVFLLVGLWYALILLTAFITRTTQRASGELQHQSVEEVRNVTEGIKRDQAVEAAKVDQENQQTEQ
jgi:uncharacterized membrane protein